MRDSRGSACSSRHTPGKAAVLITVACLGHVCWTCHTFSQLSAAGGRSQARRPSGTTVRIPGTGKAPTAAEIQQAHSMRKSGVVVKWLNLRGAGFIRPDGGGKDIYVHYTGIASTTRRAQLSGGMLVGVRDPDEEASFKSLKVGERVDFDIRSTRDGPRAVDVTGPGLEPVQGGYTVGEQAMWRPDKLMRKVYVGNLSWSTTPKALAEHMSRVGQVQHTLIKTDGFDEETGRPVSQGWGVVRYQHRSEALKAMEHLHTSHLDGRRIYVKDWTPNPTQLMRLSQREILYSKQRPGRRRGSRASLEDEGDDGDDEVAQLLHWT
mmetsp:Transcript_21461/g.49128  ORF Transcript_21461/g.49128 Transcript_21461/m.49128 type:complete len:321 (-) Transcript_21461:10-972(-)